MTSIVLCGVASVGAVTLMPSCGVALMVAYGFALVVAQEAFCRDRDDSSLDVDVCYKHCAVRCEGDVAFGDGFEANRDWLGGDVEAFPLSLFFYAEYAVSKAHARLGAVELNVVAYLDANRAGLEGCTRDFR